MGFVWLIVGVVLGYFFKPQIENGFQKVKRMIQDNRSDRDV